MSPLPLLLLALAGCATTPTDSGAGRDSAAGLDTGDSTAETPTDNDGDGAFTPDDCDDTNPAVNPDGDELLTPCDGLDNDCDGRIDDGRRVPADYALPSEALAAAEGGDLICVAPGTYVDNLDFGGKDVQMIGVQGPESTILMGASGGGSVVTFQTSETQAAVFTGFTVSGGEAESGAGVNVDDANPTLYNLVVRDNTCTAPQYRACVGVGVAIVSYRAWTVPISHLVISGNRAEGAEGCRGAGWASAGIGLVVEDTVIEDNGCSAEGVCAVVYTNGDLTLRRVVIARNSGGTSGAFVGEAATVTMNNVTVADNEADSGSAISLDYRDVGSLTNVIVAGNVSHLAGVALIVAPVVGGFELTNIDVVGNVQEGDGTAVMVSASTLTNVSIANNEVGAPNGYDDADALYIVPASDQDPATVVTFSNFWNNGPAPFGDQPSPVGENGNLAVDPGYTDLTAAAALDWDLRLRPGSALIDQGDPNILDADGSRSDIGAFGGPGGLDW